MTIIITLSFAGNETGPFDLYSDADNFAVAFATNVAKADLLAGYEVEAPAGTTTVRLDDLGALCTPSTTDIFTCASPPDCGFTGVILCNSFTTTTTTSSSSTSTTSTTYFPDPFGVPCIWSTNGGTSGLLGVYDFDTNTLTDVLVPNDFVELPSEIRSICATEDKLWIVSNVDQGSNPNNDFDDVVYIREWDIDATGVSPVLTYVREITLESGQFQGSFNAGSSVWAIAAKDNDTLIVGVGNTHTAPAGTGGSGQRWAHEFSILNGGNITIGNNDLLGSKQVGSTSGGNSVYSKLSNFTYTNSDQLVVGWYKLDTNATPQYTHYIQVFNGTPSDADFGLNNQAIQQITLEENGYPAFTPAFTGPMDVPFWGFNSLAQVLQPETLDVYTINQLPFYELTFATSLNEYEYLTSATHCSNIKFDIADSAYCIENARWFPPFFFDSEGNPAKPSNGGVYDPTPQQFQFAGMTCTASIAENVNAFDDVRQSITESYLGCSGLLRPASSVPITRAVSGSNFSITIEFPQAMNDLSIRTAVLNSNSDLTSGDVYYVETNGGTPTLSINQGCLAQVIGNRFGGGIGPDGQPSDNLSDGDDSGVEVKVTAPSDYTSMTIYGNAPSGGPLLLGCPPVNCDNMIFVEQGGTTCNTFTNPESAGRCVEPPIVPMDQVSYNKIFVWNKIADTCTEVGPPPGEGFASGDISIGDNIVVISAFYNNPGSPSIKRTFIKYDCTVINGVPSNLQWDEKQYVLPTFWDDFAGTFIPNIEVINDNQIGVTVKKYPADGAPCWFDVRFLICTFPETGEEMIVDEQFQLPCGSGDSGDLVVTYKPDGVTLNKLITLQTVEPEVVNGVLVGKLAVCQYDIATGTLEVVTKAEDFIDDSGIGASLAIVDGELYAGSSVWAKVDWNYPYAWTILPDSESPCAAGGAGTIPACRISDGFEPSPVTTTSTTTDPNTTTTTTTIPGVRTIFTRFTGFIEQE